MLKKTNLITILFLLSLIFSLSASVADTLSKNSNESISENVMKVTIQLKCLECAGQNIYESNSNFSQSIKAYVRKELQMGKNTEEIISDLHNKYGDEILMTPPIQTNTYVLWIFPFLLLALGFLILCLKLKK
tara:strand:+ start:400 stop:795 length:396 start_codon:yes stop_codon:yes gene_type:complete